MVIAPMFVAIIPWMIVVILNWKISRLIKKKGTNIIILFAIVTIMFICSTPIMANQALDSIKSYFESLTSSCFGLIYVVWWYITSVLR